MVVCPDERLELAPGTIESIAKRVSELLTSPATRSLIDASEVARRYGISRSWVYENATELGAVRLGRGPKAPLRFHPDRVAEALTSRSTGESSQPRVSKAAKPRRGRRRKGHVRQRGDLLPIREPK